MKIKRKNIISIFLLSITMVFMIRCESNNVLVKTYSFDGTYRLKWNDLPSLMSDSDFKLGGFQSIDYVGDNEFVFVTGRGPALSEIDGTNERINFLEAEYTPEIVRVKFKDNNDITIAKRNSINSVLGDDVTGVPLLDNVAIENDNLNGSMWGINPTGIAYNPHQNTFWLTEKYDPAMIEVTGRWGDLGEKEGYADIIRRFKPFEGLRKYYKDRLGNGGFSGLAIDNNQRLWSVVEKYLINYPVVFVDGELVSLDTLQLYKDKRRIVRKDPGQYTDECAIYQVEPESLDGVKPEDVEITSIAVYNDTTCYITEYGKTGENVRNLLVKVICPKNSWYSPIGEGLFWVDEETDVMHLRTFETLSEVDRDSINTQNPNKQVLYSNKKEVMDLSVDFDGKPVGMTLINSRQIALLQEQNYGIKSGDIETGDVNLENQDVKVKIVNIKGF